MAEEKKGRVKVTVEVEINEVLMDALRASIIRRRRKEEE